MGITAWRHRARCRELGTDTNLFYRADTNRELRDRLRMSVCGPCPVRKECLQANLTVPDGMFGGYTWRERRFIASRMGIKTTRWTSFFDTKLDSYEKGLIYRAHNQHRANKVEWLEGEK
jgi:hypothetical protein